jgi:hypothetical protein
LKQSLPGCVYTFIQSRKDFLPNSGWPGVLKRFAAEAWRRVEAGELTDKELYCCDAQWSGLYDRMFPHKQDEIDRRLSLAADYGEALNA